MKSMQAEPYLKTAYDSYAESKQREYNGQNHSVSGWQQATYINGKPYGVDDGGQYVQTCGPDGKVWYGKIN